MQHSDRYAVLLTLLLVGAASMHAGPQTSQQPDLQNAKPDFRLLVLGYFDAETLAEFNKRIQNYVELRRQAERGVVPLKITTNPDEITASEVQLTAALRRIRGSSDRGQIFPHRIGAQLQKLFSAQVDQSTLAAIMEDGPGEFDVDVNETYQKDRPLATMPANLLQVLPELPQDIEYRFVGRRLILRDVRANMIIDEIPKALRCDACVSVPEPISGEHER